MSIVSFNPDELKGAGRHFRRITIYLVALVLALFAAKLSCDILGANANIYSFFLGGVVTTLALALWPILLSNENRKDEFSQNVLGASWDTGVELGIQFGLVFFGIVAVSYIFTDFSFYGMLAGGVFSVVFVLVRDHLLKRNGFVSKKVD